jgi:hypothetical protein
VRLETKWHWGRLSRSMSIYPVSSHSTITAHCSLIILSPTLYRLVTDSSANNKLRTFLSSSQKHALTPVLHNWCDLPACLSICSAPRPRQLPSAPSQLNHFPPRNQAETDRRVVTVSLAGKRNGSRGMCVCTYIIKCMSDCRLGLDW